MRDVKAITDLCIALGGLSAAARELSTPSKLVSAQHIYNWRKRGRVAPEQRLNFLTVFNRVMPKRKLDMQWLASPAAHYGKGSASNGGKSSRKARKRKASKRRQAQDKRGETRPRP